MPAEQGERSLPVLRPTGFHNLSYRIWGETGPTIICVHGLTRNSRDFDKIAGALAGSRQVVCPDVLGRGKSEYIPDPTGYTNPLYAQDLATLIARLDTPQVDWIGNSMGGIIGMLLAAAPNTPIRSLVLNDIGAFVPKEALQRIASYVGLRQVFQTIGQLEAHLRDIHAPFGPMSDEDWQHMAVHSATPTHDGFTLAYDPMIGVPLQFSSRQDALLWDIWERIECPVLLLRGEHSDILSSDVATEMMLRGPGAKKIATLIEFAGCGHVPSLTSAGQIAAVMDWLDRNAPA